MTGEVVRGPAGPQGPKGLTGAQGPKGATGPAGPAGAKGDTGATGPAGPVGPAGAKGDPGTPATSGYQIVSQAFSLPAGGLTDQTVQCPAGKKPVGGGFDLWTATGADPTKYLVRTSYPTTTGWRVLAQNADTRDAVTLGIYAACMNAT